MITSEGTSLRVDRLLVYLRFARTRSAARAMIEGRSLRLNRKHVQRVSENVSIGDILTLAVGNEVRVIELVALPGRRASPEQARTYYRELARNAELNDFEPRGRLTKDPEWP